MCNLGQQWASVLRVAIVGSNGSCERHSPHSCVVVACAHGMGPTGALVAVVPVTFSDKIHHFPHCDVLLLLIDVHGD